MKLWLLRRRSEEHPKHDVQNGVVVRAHSPYRARELTADNQGDEGYETWLDPEISSCKSLKEEGSEGVICRDFNAG